MVLIGTQINNVDIGLDWYKINNVDIGLDWYKMNNVDIGLGQCDKFPVEEHTLYIGIKEKFYKRKVL